MNLKEFLEQLNNGEWIEVDELKMQYHYSENKIRIVTGNGRVVLRLVKGDANWNEKKYNKIKEKLGIK